MARAIVDIEKGRGRPRTNATPVMVRLQPDQLAALDAWIAGQNKSISRPEAIRAILAAGLVVMGSPVKSGRDE
jgi:hypothetical protein